MPAMPIAESSAPIVVGALWCALAVLLFLLLCPDRIRAGEAG